MTPITIIATATGATCEVTKYADIELSIENHRGSILDNLKGERNKFSCESVSASDKSFLYALGSSSHERLRMPCSRTAHP